MTKSLKAACLSAFLGSGAGHLYLKRYRRGAFLIISTLCCLVILATQAMQQARVIFNKIPTGAETVSFDEVSVLLQENFGGQDFFITNAVTMVMMLIWTFSIIDAYKLGKDTTPVTES